jgi:uncharacterized membrane protein
VNAYLWLKLLHVLAAIIAVGTNVTYFVWLRLVRDQPTDDAFVLNGLYALDRRLANPAYIVLPVTGIIMVLVGDIGFSTFWVAASLVLFIALAVFAGVAFTPSLKRQLQLAQTGGGRGSPEYAAAAKRTTTTGALTMVIIAAIVFFMVMKPG